MSSFVRRMQPDETLVPMVQGSLVPWMRYSVSLLPLQRYMARAPSGLSGPPFMPMPLCNCTMCWRSSGLRADAHAIANGLSGVVDDVKKMTIRIDDDRSRPLVCRVGDDLAGEGGIRPSRLSPRRKNVRM